MVVVVLMVVVVETVDVRDAIVVETVVVVW